MVRQRTRKSVEELYAPKFETVVPKSLVNNNMSKNSRNTDRGDFAGYIITSNAAYTANPNNGSSPTQTNGQYNNAVRRKAVRPETVRAPQKSDKFYGHDEKTHIVDNKKDHVNNKAKTQRAEKIIYSQNIYDNKNYANFPDSVIMKDQPHQHEHQHHHGNSSGMHHHAGHVSHDDDRDDDTEEFFQLIRQTVEKAIGKSISELLNRNFRELSAKVDRFSAELKATNNLLNKLQAEVNNKVVHYGEENSRHFRYLCMKSEYDKMFYQHHAMMASTTTTANKRPKMPKPGLSGDCDAPMHSPCTCRGTRKTQNDTHKSSSEEHVSNKSSELGMREVLEHIQRFCNEMQLNGKEDDRTGKTNYNMEELKIDKEMFEDDDDDYQMSSDGMTPRSDENLSEKFIAAANMRNNARGGNGCGNA